jgi:trigger factor
MTTSAIEFSVEAAGPCRKRVKVKIPEARVSEEFDKSYRQWIKSVPIPGFRQGKAPRSLVERRFGKQVAVEVKQSLLDAAFEQALKENDLSPIADPELDLEAIEVEPSKALDFDFTITVKPEFELPDLKGIEVEVPPAEPTDEEVERALEGLRKSKATLRPLAKGAIKAEDVVTLKLRGSDGEEEVVARDDLPYTVGSRMLGDLIADGLDEKLTGEKAGASVEAKAFAPPYVENHPLAGRDIAIRAEVLDVKRPDLPPLDDALAKTFDFDSKDELVDAVTKDVARRKEQERERLIDNLALAQLVEKADIELPAELIEREVEDLARRTAYEMQMQDASEEDIAKQVAQVREQRAEESERELKAFFLLDKIVEKERIIVTENEVRDAVGQIAAYNNVPPEQMYVSLRDSGRLSSLRNQLREKKAREKLRKKVKVSDAPTEKKGKSGAAKAAPKKKAAAKKTANKATKKKTTKKAPKKKADE